MPLTINFSFSPKKVSKAIHLKVPIVKNFQDNAVKGTDFSTTAHVSL